MPQFDIIIGGAGLVGLATSIGLKKKGHKVHIVESTSALSVIGDAIAVGANQQRVLDHYGILPAFHAKAVKDLGHMYHRSFSTGETISVRDMKLQEADYGYASFILSRAGYQDYLYQEAKKLDVEFLFGSRIESVIDNAVRPVVILQDGTKLEADIVIGADGVKSKVREVVSSNINLTSSQDCYRTTISHEQLQNDPDFLEYLHGIHFFMGPNVLVVLENMFDVKAVSLNLYCTGNIGTAGAWKAAADPEDVRRIFKNCSPTLQKMLALIDNCVVWRVTEVQPMDSWVSSNGKIVVVGDACHAMEPHHGQGTEDGATVAECISYAKTIEDVPSLLRLYQEIRKPRAELVQAQSTLLGKIWTMPDGEQQRQRDENMRKAPIYSRGAWDGKPIYKLPSGLMDPTWSPWLTFHDAIGVARKELESRA